MYLYVSGGPCLRILFSFSHNWPSMIVQLDPSQSGPVSHQALPWWSDWRLASKFVISEPVFFLFFFNYPFRHSSFTSCCRWEKAKPLHCNSFYSLNTQFQCILYKVAAICTILCHQAFMIIPVQKVESQFSGGCHQWMSWPHHSVACYNRVCNLLCF